MLRANWYEPGLNPTYRDLAAHYGTAILPTRVRRPRDKAKVEAGVLVVERWILARLRHQRFASLAALNAAIAALLADLNTRPMRRLGVSRRQLFEELDRPALAALPAEPFVYAEWRIRRVGLDYHVDVEGHYYSAPHRLLRQQVEARSPPGRWSCSTRASASPSTSAAGCAAGTPRLPEHMPQAHRRHAEWTIERIGREAAAIGPATAALTALILESRPHPEQGFRACLGILRLLRTYGRDRLEAACARGLEIGARSYGSIQSILQHGLDRQPAPRPAAGGRRPAPAAPEHPGLRLLPLRRTAHADPPHPRPAAPARPRRHGAGLRGSRCPGPGAASWPRPNGSACCSTARSPTGTTAG